MNLNKLCRLCAVKIKMLHPIFGSNLNPNMRKMIETCCPIKITAEDRLPTQICSGCYEKLEISYNFHVQILEADETLNELLLDRNKSLIKSEKNDEKIVFVFKDDENIKKEEYPDSDEDDPNSSFNDDVFLYAEEQVLNPFSTFEFKTMGNERKFSSGADDDNDDDEEKKETKQSLDDFEFNPVEDDAMGEINLKNIKTDVDFESKISEIQHLDGENETKVATNCTKRKRSKRRIIIEKKEKDKQAEEEEEKKDEDIKQICHICGALLKKSSFNRHVKDVHRQLYVKCDVCNQTLKSRAILRRHKEIHIKLKLPCALCKKVYSNKKALRSHILHVHEATTRFKCHMCGKGFSSRQKLSNHHLMHTGETPFPCKYCTKSFKSVSYRQQHELLHRKKDAFYCFTCRQNYTSKGNLHNHIRSSHCRYCGGGFKTPSLLRFHVKKTHGSHVDVSFKERSVKIESETDCKGLYSITP